MPIRTNCPICGKRLNIPDHLAGKRVKCFCGTIFTAKEAQPVAPRPQPVVISEEEAVEETEKPSRFRLPFELPFDEECLKQQLPTAVKTVLPLVIAAVAVMFLAPMLWSSHFLQLNQLFEASPKAALAPAICASFFGACYGLGLGYLLSGKAGCVGALGCTVGMTAVILPLLATTVSGWIFMDLPLPALWHVVMMCVGFLSSLVVTIYTLLVR